MTKASQETVGNNSAKGKRGPQGPRDRYYVCAGSVEKDDGPEIVQDFILVNRESSESEMEDQAIEQFQVEHGVEPSSVVGPVFRVQTKTQSTGVRKRQSVRMDIDDIRFSGRTAHAALNGWNVVVQYIKDEGGKERKDVAYAMFKDEVAPGETKRARPQHKVVALSSLENLRHAS